MSARLKTPTASFPPCEQQAAEKGNASKRSTLTSVLPFFQGYFLPFLTMLL